jgi:hypothetical protein
VENKGQLDVTDWILLQNLSSSQHVSGTIMPIIRSSRIIQMVAACGTWLFGLPVIGLVWSCRFCVSRLQSNIHTRPMTGKRKSHVPQAATICIIIERLMMGIMVPETC